MKQRTTLDPVPFLDSSVLFSVVEKRFILAYLEPSVGYPNYPYPHSVWMFVANNEHPQYTQDYTLLKTSGLDLTVFRTRAQALTALEGILSE